MLRWRGNEEAGWLDRPGMRHKKRAALLLDKTTLFWREKEYIANAISRFTWLSVQMIL